eukprot:3031839-Pyramimonas_sp.AAC.1
MTVDACVGAHVLPHAQMHLPIGSSVAESQSVSLIDVWQVGHCDVAHGQCMPIVARWRLVRTRARGEAICQGCACRGCLS